MCSITGNFGLQSGLSKTCFIFSCTSYVFPGTICLILMIFGNQWYEYHIYHLKEICSLDFRRRRVSSQLSCTVLLLYLFGANFWSVSLLHRSQSGRSDHGVCESGTGESKGRGTKWRSGRVHKQQLNSRTTSSYELRTQNPNVGHLTFGPRVTRVKQRRAWTEVHGGARRSREVGGRLDVPGSIPDGE